MDKKGLKLAEYTEDSLNFISINSEDDPSFNRDSEDIYELNKIIGVEYMSMFIILENLVGPKPRRARIENKLPQKKILLIGEFHSTIENVCGMDNYLCLDLDEFINEIVETSPKMIDLFIESKMGKSQNFFGGGLVPYYYSTLLQFREIFEKYSNHNNYKEKNYIINDEEYSPFNLRVHNFDLRLSYDGFDLSDGKSAYLSPLHKFLNNLIPINFRNLACVLLGIDYEDIHSLYYKDYSLKEIQEILKITSFRFKTTLEKQNILLNIFKIKKKIKSEYNKFLPNYNIFFTNSSFRTKFIDIINEQNKNETSLKLKIENGNFPYNQLILTDFYLFLRMFRKIGKDDSAKNIIVLGGLSHIENIEIILKGFFGTDTLIFETEIKHNKVITYDDISINSNIKRSLRFTPINKLYDIIQNIAT